MVEAALMTWERLHACALVLAICSCAPTASGRPAASGHDEPIAASVPRAQAAFAIDLPPAVDCEERFDLALYQNRGVELIRWDELQGRCSGRVIAVSYLPGSLAPDKLAALVAKIARRAEPYPEKKSP